MPYTDNNISAAELVAAFTCCYMSENEERCNLCPICGGCTDILPDGTWQSAKTQALLEQAITELL